MKNENSRKHVIGRIILWIILALVVLGIVLMAIFKPAAPEPEAPPEKSVAVRTLLIEPQAVPLGITVPARIEPFVETVLSAEKSGRVVEILAEKGDLVKQGRILMRLDDRTSKAMLEQAEIENRQMAADLKRWQEMEKSGAVSTKESEDIKLRKEASDIAVRQEEIGLSQCFVKSPVDGQISSRMVEEGEYANEGQPVFTVVDTSRVKVRFDIPERRILSVGKGTEMGFTGPALGGRTFTGTVSFVSPAANRENNAFPAELLVENAAGDLKPGMVVAVDLPLGVMDNAVAVPLAAVIPKKGEHVVFVVEEGRAVRRLVKLDRILDDRAVLSEGLSAGDQLVIEGHRALSDGVLLDIMN